LAVGIAFATPAIAFEPKLSPMQEFVHEPRAYAKTLLTPKEFGCLDHLVKLESHWNAKAKNPSSSAYGIFQFLNQTWKNYNFIKTSNPIIQVNEGLHYITARYGSACNALSFHLRHGYY